MFAAHYQRRVRYGPGPGPTGVPWELLGFRCSLSLSHMLSHTKRDTKKGGGLLRRTWIRHYLCCEARVKSSCGLR